MRRNPNFRKSLIRQHKDLECPLLDDDFAEDEEVAEPEDEFAGQPVKGFVSRVVSSILFQICLFLLVFVDVACVIGVIVLENVQVLVYVAAVFTVLFLMEYFTRMWLVGLKRFFWSDCLTNTFNIVEGAVLLLALGVSLAEIYEHYRMLNNKNTPINRAEEKALIDIAVIPIIVLRIFKLFFQVWTRWYMTKKIARQYISADRRRYKKDGFDLDLTYIVDNVIAMSWPSTSVEAFYRNNIRDVGEFLDNQHPEHYRVYPLCAERAYENKYFHDSVHRFMLEDHNPCDVSMMIDLVLDVKEWLSRDEQNIVVIHCKGGKGRTGTMICSWLLFSKSCEDGTSAMRYFGTLRSSDNASKVQGVESPSQDRYVKYFDALLKEFPENDIAEIPSLISTKPIHLNQVVITDCPATVTEVSKLWFVIMAGSSNHLLYLSDGNQQYTETPSHKWVPSGKQHPPRQSEPVRGDGKVQCEGNVLTWNLPHCGPWIGDLHVRFFYPVVIGRFRKKIKMKTLFELWIHTHFITDPVTVLTRKDIDGPHKDKKRKVFSDEFGLELHMELSNNDSTNGIDSAGLIPTRQQPVEKRAPVAAPPELPTTPSTTTTDDPPTEEAESKPLLPAGGGLEGVTPNPNVSPSAADDEQL